MGIFVFTNLKSFDAKNIQKKLQEKFLSCEKKISLALKDSKRGSFSPEEITNIVLVGYEKMKKLNLLFRKKNYPTDVLTFLGERGDSKHYADIFICVPVAQKQAKSYNLTLFDEILVLAAHGLAHAGGLDHEKKTEEKKFQSLENKILSILNTKKMGLVKRSRESSFIS